METIGKIFFLAVFLLPAACGPGDSGTREEDSKRLYEPEASEVEVMELRCRPFAMQLVANGKLCAAERSVLYFGQSGRITAIEKGNGATVEKGGVIARLDDTEQRAALETARIEMERTRLEYLDVLAGLGYAVADTARVPSDVQEVAGIRSGYSAARNNYGKALRDLAGTVLYAPFSGKVADVQAKKWDRTGTEPFCTLIADDRFDVVFSALESEYSFLERGQTVHVTPFGQERTVEGRIRSINPTVDARGQIAVTAAIPGSAGLLDGMNVKVTVDKVETGQLVVPKSAVVIRDGLEVLFRLQDGRAEWVYVQILRANADSYAVAANTGRGAVLREGDRIIISGNLNLADGSAVETGQ